MNIEEAKRLAEVAVDELAPVTVTDGQVAALAVCRYVLEAPDERERALAILEEEMERGRSLLGLLDHGGRPIFDDKVMIACLEAIQYCAERIKGKRP